MKDEAMNDGTIRKPIHFLFLFIVSSFIFSSAAFAAPLIRDAEIEHTLREYADPLFAAAGLKPSAVRIFIVQDDALNAFVAGGSNLFLHTGLIKACDTPDMLIGVMAHETGHISGGHLAKGAEKLKDAQLGSIFSYVLGAAAAVASRKPEAAAVVISGSETTIGRNYLAFTRAHEEAADQAALGLLDQLGISASGLAKTFALLQRHERERGGSPDPYLLTHPLSSSRIEHIRHHVETSPIPEGQYPKKFAAPHQRMLAKIYGFLESPERTFQRYPLSNRSTAARMARAVAYYKMPDVQKSLAEMDSLIKESPKDPFLHELKGQILFENARVEESLASYAQAASLLPDSPLILTDLGKVGLSQKEPLVSQSIAYLEKANTIDNSNPDTWHWLAAAYEKAGRRDLSFLALAEKSMLAADYKTALDQVGQALLSLNEGTPARQRALDLKVHAIEMQRKADEK